MQISSYVQNKSDDDFGSSDSDHDGGAVVPEKIYLQLKKQFQDLEQKYKASKKELNGQIDCLRKKLELYQDLNLKLQQQLFDKSENSLELTSAAPKRKNNQGEGSLLPEKRLKISAAPESSKGEEPLLPQKSLQIGEEVLIDQEEDDYEPDLHQNKDDEGINNDTGNDIVINGVVVDKSKLDYLIKNKRISNSIFVQDVAYNFVWKEDLKERSVTGKKCKNKKNATVKQKLETDKLLATVEMFRMKVKHDCPSISEDALNITCSVQTVESYIKTKIQNLNKTKKN